MGQRGPIWDPSFPPSFPPPFPRRGPAASAWTTGAGSRSGSNEPYLIGTSPPFDTHATRHRPELATVSRHTERPAAGQPPQRTDAVARPSRSAELTASGDRRN